LWRLFTVATEDLFRPLGVITAAQVTFFFSINISNGILAITSFGGFCRFIVAATFNVF